jgi:hypothetical protein
MNKGLSRLVELRRKTVVRAKLYVVDRGQEEEKKPSPVRITPDSHRLGANGNNRCFSAFPVRLV